MNRSSNNIIPFPRESTADIEIAAAQWLVRMQSGTTTAGDLVDHAMWRAEAPEHDRMYREMERTWAAVGARGMALGRSHGLFGRLLRQRTWLNLRNGLVAACVVLAAGGAMLAQETVSVWQYDYHTGPGEIRRVALADGSTVTMKGDTALDVHVSAAGARRIDIARGEAFFEVAHDAARPFLVDAGSAIVKDVGTGFSVRRNGQSGSVGVDHGVVEVVAAGKSDILGKGQQVDFGLYDLGRKIEIAPGTIAAWRRGLYIAENKPLSDVLGDLDEYRSGRIIVTSAALRDRRINAVVQLGHIDAWLETLGSTPGVSVRRLGSFVIVSEDTR